MTDAKHEGRLLYHATYRVHLDSILTWGLGHEIADTHKNWEDSKHGVVCLATDIDVALSFAETSENAPDEWIDDIVILVIDAGTLDAGKLSSDGNIIDNDGTSLEHHGIIGSESILRVLDMEGNPLKIGGDRKPRPR